MAGPAAHLPSAGVVIEEVGQGIGYLDDGTMVVVENGRAHIGEALDVLVTSVLQTAAGRIAVMNWWGETPSSPLLIPRLRERRTQ